MILLSFGSHKTFTKHPDIIHGTLPIYHNLKGETHIDLRNLHMRSHESSVKWFHGLYQFKSYPRVFSLIDEPENEVWDKHAGGSSIAGYWPGYRLSAADKPRTCLWKKN